MTRVVRIHAFGGTDVLSVEDDEIGAPGPGQVLHAQAGMAVHFADTMLREGKYFLKPQLPAVIGLDGAGTVEAVGPGVTAVKPGDAVCYLFNLGAYAERRLIDADALMPVPAGVEVKHMAGTLLRGMTAQYLLRQCYRVGPGDAVLIHTGAGGTGTLLCQWAKHLGALVIGTVGSDDVGGACDGVDRQHDGGRGVRRGLVEREQDAVGMHDARPVRARCRCRRGLGER